MIKRTTLAAVAAMAVVCARAEAAVYTTSVASSFVGGDDTGTLMPLYVPSFNASLGNLNSTTIALNGFALSTLDFLSGYAPTSGAFFNNVQFYGAPPIGLPLITNTNTSATTRSIQESFAVIVSETFSPTLIALPGQQLEVLIRINSTPTQGFSSRVITQFTGTLSASYDYTPTQTAVPEPMSLILLFDANGRARDCTQAWNS